jgi:hypothetical protein
MPRKPLPGWRKYGSFGTWHYLELGECRLSVDLDNIAAIPGLPWFWHCEIRQRDQGNSLTLESAQLAAEDAAREQVKQMAEDLGMEVKRGEEA